MAVVLMTKPQIFRKRDLEGAVVELVRRVVGDEGHASSREVEVIEAESEPANALIGVEVEAEVVGATLPAQLNVGIDYITDKTLKRDQHLSQPCIEDQRSCDLLCNPRPKVPRSMAWSKSNGLEPCLRVPPPVIDSWV